MSDIGINTTHAILAFIFGICIVALGVSEMALVHPFTDLMAFWVAVQSVGLGVANSFYVSNLVLSSAGLQETTSSSTPAPVQKTASNA